MIVLKTLFLKELVSKSAIFKRDFEICPFEIKVLGIFFDTELCAAGQARSRILTQPLKSSQQNSAVFHTRQYSARTMSVL